MFYTLCFNILRLPAFNNANLLFLMAISFSIYNFFDLGPLFQERNYGVK